MGWVMAPGHPGAFWTLLGIAQEPGSACPGEAEGGKRWEVGDAPPPPPMDPGDDDAMWGCVAVVVGLGLSGDREVNPDGPRGGHGFSSGAPVVWGPAVQGCLAQVSRPDTAVMREVWFSQMPRGLAPELGGGQPVRW